MQHIPPANEDTWFNAEGQIEGRLSLLRIRPELRSFAMRDLFSKLLTVSWTYGDDEVSGMPGGDEIDLMKQLEDRLVQEFESTKVGILSFIVTERGVRTWSFYVNGSEGLKNAINSALASMPRLPIELRLKPDPDWTSFNSYASALGEA
jgi:hypothetical protein